MRQSDEEKVLVVLNNAKVARTITVPILDTPAEGTSSTSPLYGPAKATAAPVRSPLTHHRSRFLFFRSTERR